MARRFALPILMSLALAGAALVAAEPVAAAATCTSSIGPGIPPPAGATFGTEGFHAAWYGQSGYMSLCASAESTATVAYYNTGTRGWVLGKLGETAYLGTTNPTPGQDQPSTLGGDGTNGSPATGWPRYNRLAIQPAPYVGPGQVAWFQFKVRAPLTPGRYRIALRPLIEGAQWMEDYGVFWNVTVLNPDGTQPPISIGGLNFNPASTTRADVYTELAISRIDTSAVLAVVDADIARIEADFGRSFAGRPILYVFASQASATFGIQTIALQTTVEAVELAKFGGFYDPVSGSVFLNWANVSGDRPITVARHELTHMLFQQIAGRSVELPAWFNEGNARLEELTAPGSTWLANAGHYTAASAAAQVPSSLVGLTDLVSEVVWKARAEPLLSFEYDEAAEAARFVRQDLGPAGTVRLLDLMRQGQSFDAAFQTVTGKASLAFAVAFPPRLKATVATYPGVALATDTRAGPGVTYIAYGFAPSTSLNVTISVAGYQSVTITGATDPFGVSWNSVTVANGWPLGSYTITVTDGVRTVTSTTMLSAVAPGRTMAIARSASGAPVA